MNALVSFSTPFFLNVAFSTVLMAPWRLSVPSVSSNKAGDATIEQSIVAASNIHPWNELPPNRRRQFRRPSDA
jgi:hypothetical protein